MYLLKVLDPRENVFAKFTLRGEFAIEEQR